MPVVKEREYRTLITPLAAARSQTSQRINTEQYVEGYAATFDTPYIIYEDWDGNKYYETIARGALDKTDMSDVIMQYNHEGKVLARNSNGTLGVEIDGKGLFVFADLSKSRAAKDMYEEISAQLINKMSWAFTVTVDSYDKKTRTRTIMEVKKMYDVSAVSYPANTDTDISARSWINGVIEAEKREALARRKKIIQLKLKLEV